MFSQRKLIFIFLLFMIVSCIQINVYVPGYIHHNPVEQPPPQKYYQIHYRSQTNHFAEIDPMIFDLFYDKKYDNLQGRLEVLIDKELQRNAEKYRSFLIGNEELIIDIDHFLLKSSDYCSNNISQVELKIQTSRTGQPDNNFSFHYHDEIDSLTGDCYTIAVSLPLFLGWVWYMPYLGFRGNREDQLNQLGRIALIQYFQELEKYLERRNRDE